MDKIAENQGTSFTKGLEGIVAAQTALSFVNGQEGRLFYRGIEIHDLIQHSSFEETAYLLWYGTLPTREALNEFSGKLASQRKIPKEIEALILAFPKKTPPMVVLRTAVSALAIYDPESENNTPESNAKKAMKLLAQLPTLIAYFDRSRNGKSSVAPDEKLAHADNFLYMLTGKAPGRKEAKALDAYLILLADHGLNASTFAARVTISTLSDMYSAIVSAIGTLKGDLHGSANQRAMEMFLRIGDLANAESHILGLLKDHKKVPGFGHRVYKGEDPRAKEFRKISYEVCHGTSFDRWNQMSTKIEEIVWREKKIPCNVDFYSASVLYALGIPADLFTPIFAISRLAGWTAHVTEQLADNRLIRPEAQYVGPMNQPYVPLEKRQRSPK